MLNGLKKSIKKILPKRLYSRLLLIIFVPFILLQLITVYIFYERHWDSLSRNINFSLSNEISFIITRFYDAYPDVEYITLFEDARRHTSISYKFLPNQDIPKIRNFYLKPEYKNFIEHLAKALQVPVAIDEESLKQEKRVIIYAKIPEGVIEIIIPAKKIANQTTYIFVMWVLGSGIFLVIASLLLIKNQVRSIINLTSAARDFGKGNFDNFKPSGAYEIRLAGVAFIQMQERIKKLIERKTQTLADVSHDIKTPLTRMNLELELLPDAINKETGKVNKELSPEAIQSFKESIKTDVIELQNLIKEYLEYAASEIAPQVSKIGEAGLIENKKEEVNLFKFFRSLIYDFRNYNVNIVQNTPYDAVIFAEESQLRRAITNIISNAISYASAVNITVLKKPASTLIIIDDNGVGIKKEEKQKVFDPFYKTDKSRGKRKGKGSGLGLAIAKDIIIKNGGSIRLGENVNSSQGLRVIIRMPF